MNAKSKSRVHIFTDGACSGNPGPGGYGVILRFNDHEKELSGGARNTTNNRMELTAVIEGLSALKKPCQIELTTDSEYVKKGTTEWLKSWKKKGWKNSNNKPIANRDLWEILDHLIQKHKIYWHWVRGHTNHPENERADELAREALEDYR